MFDNNYTMNNKGNLSSNFFLLFGILFTGLIYACIKYIPSFYYLNQTWYIPLLICLVLLILFLLISRFSKKIPLLFLKNKFSFNKKTDVNVLSKEIAIQKSKSDITELVSRFRKVVNSLVIHNYSNESIDSLMSSIGLDNSTAANVLSIVKKHRQLRKLIYILGLVVSVGIYFVIEYAPFTQFITNPYIPFLVSFVIFVLFSLESILITKMPDSFYIKLMNINQEKIIEINNKMILQAKELENTKLEVSKTLGNLSQVISYLLSVGINKSDAAQILTKYGLSEPVAMDFVEKVELENKDSLTKKAPALSNVLKLSLTKVQEDFTSLQSLYGKMSILNNQVTTLTEKQKQLELVMGKKDIIINQNQKFSSNDAGVYFALRKDAKLQMPTDNDKKYQEMLDVLYNLLYPYAKESTQNKFVSMLVSTGYSYEIATDLSAKFEKNEVFKKKRDLIEMVVDLINGSYEKVSKNKIQKK